MRRTTNVINRHTEATPFHLNDSALLIARLFCALLLVLCLGMFALANYGQAAQWVFGDCNLIYFEPDYRPNCSLWRDAITNTGLTPAVFEGYFVLLRVVAALPFVFLSVILMRRRGRELRVFLLVGFLLLVGTAGPIYNPFWQWATAWFTIENQVPALPLFIRLLDFMLSVGTAMFVFLFPDGKFVPKWARWVAVVWLIMRAGDVFFPNTPASLYTLSYPMAVILNTTFTLCGIVAIIWRYRVHADAVQRQQIKWITAGALLLAFNYVLDYTVFEIYPAVTNAYLVVTREQGVIWELIQDTLWYVSQFIFAICVGLAVFRHRLWDIDLILNRSLVYGTLTALIIAGYVFIVGGLGALFHTQTVAISGLVATGVIAVLFQPLRDRVQYGVNRLLYGERDDPAAVLTRLATHLRTAATSSSILPTLLQTIASTLRIPYVALRLTPAHQPEAVVSWGAADYPTQGIPLIYQNESVGQLIVSARGPQEIFNRDEQQLLSTIAALTATTVRAVQLSDELQRSRQRIITAREEERRRLRRDLHDGLGPALAGLPLKVDAALDLVEQNRDTSIRLLNEVKKQAQQLVGEVRRVIHDLRPPTLDELGLSEALRGALTQITTPPPGPSIILRTGELPRELPAAIEVAAYRITMEAVTNVMKHARACQCHVSLEVISSPCRLCIAIEDDGVGLPETVVPNVGLHSMRERAEELGGTFQLQPRPGGGTSITVMLPLPDGNKS